MAEQYFVRIKNVQIVGKDKDDKKVLNICDVKFHRLLEFTGTIVDTKIPEAKKDPKREKSEKKFVMESLQNNYTEFKTQLMSCFTDVFEGDDVTINCDIEGNEFPEDFNEKII